MTDASDSQSQLGHATLAALSAPFAYADIRFRQGQVRPRDRRDKSKGYEATLFSYVGVRAVQQRLDDVLGLHWGDTVVTIPGGFVTGIMVRAGSEWVTRTDGAELGANKANSLKTGISDSFKRAAVKYGVGRYIRRLPKAWHKVKAGWGHYDVDIQIRLSPTEQERKQGHQPGHVGHVMRPVREAYVRALRQLGLEPHPDDLLEELH
jgi:hypothetical protein